MKLSHFTKTMLFIYVMFVLATTQFNPLAWSELVRIIAIILSSIIGWCFAIYGKEIAKDVNGTKDTSVQKKH
jgi:hypothetical protein